MHFQIRRKLEKRQSMKIFGSTVNIGSIANLQSNISKFFGEKKSNQSASEANLGGENRNHSLISLSFRHSLTQ